MPDKLEPHVARIVRTSSIKEFSRDAEALQRESFPNPLSFPSPSKSVNYLTNFFYQQAQINNLAIFKCFFPSKRAKKNAGVVGVWITEKSHLYAQVYSIEGFPKPQHSMCFSIRVSDHAIERISERLDSIDKSIIRNELCAAVASVALFTPFEESDYYAKTPHGVAMVRSSSTSAPVITTWLSLKMLKKGQIAEEWAQLVGGSQASLSVVNGCKVYQLQKQSPAPSLDL